MNLPKPGRNAAFRFGRRAGLAIVLAAIFATSFGGTFTCRGRSGSATFNGSYHTGDD